MDLPLPERVELSDGRQLLVDFMTRSQISECYRMIEEDMKCGVGFNSREFSSEAEWLSTILNGRFFAVTDVPTGEMVAGFVICDNSGLRIKKCGDGHMVVKPEWRHKGLCRLVIRLSFRLARSLGHDYLLADPFSNNPGMILPLLAEGFREVGRIPTGGQTPDGETIAVVLLLRQLSDTPFQGAAFSKL